MADKRISQLVDRGTVLNNDVIPIVVSGAVTTNKATISSIQTFMQSNLDVGVTSVGITLGSTGTDVNVTGSPVTSSGNITINLPTASATNRGLLSSANWTTFNNKVSSVGLSMPSAFAVANSPITGSGTIAVTGAGTVAQYIRGDGSLADFPEGGGGGSAVNYYLNGSVSQGTIGGIGYYEMNKVPVLGAGNDFVAIADGYLASFITDAGDPGLLEIPAGNWNFETYFSASSGGGSPSFYIELYKVNSGGTATLIASNSATPELIAFGTVINPYFSALAVPTTVLTITDRLALRYYVARSGRTITLHTENSHLCQIITTFTTGLTALNGLTAQVQNFATGTSGTDFGISSASTTHTFNLPTASAVNRGALSSADWTTFNGKQTALNGTGFVKISGTTISYDNSTYLTTASAASTYVPYTGAGANVDLGIYNLTANAVNVNASGSSAGVINLESNTIFSLVNGYGTIGSGTTNQFNFYQTTGAGVFRGAILSLNSITASATRTFTLPDADGTLALTTDLGAYLPLAGGTLTGALNGTSAVFTGNVLLGGSTATNPLSIRTANGESYIRFLNADGTTYGDFERSITGAGAVRFTGANFRFTGGAEVVGALSGTSASFSGQIISTVGNNLNVFKSISATTGFQSIQLANTSGNGVWILGSSTGTEVFSNGSAYATQIGTLSATSLQFGTNSSINLTLASTGAATFSSSVTATQLNATTTAAGYASILTNTNGASDSNGLLVKAGSVSSEYVVRFAPQSDASTFFTVKGNGNVGIGTASPSAISTFTTLEIRGSTGGGIKIGKTAFAQFNIQHDGTDAYFNNTANGSLYMYTNDTERMRISSDGDIGIGTDSNSLVRLLTRGKDSGTVNYAFIAQNSSATNLFTIKNDGAANFFSLGTGTVTATAGTLSTVSDSSYKIDDGYIDSALEKVLSLKPRYFYWNEKSGLPMDIRQLGFYAQEVNESLGEEAANTPLDENTPWGITDRSIIAMLTKAIQEQQEQINQLKNQIK